MLKLTSLIITFVLVCSPIFAQKSKRPLGWDLTYSSILKSNKISSKAWIRKWLAQGYQTPVKKWISEWRGEPIISSVLIEHPAFHAAEYSTMWLVRTKNHAYYREYVEGMSAGIRKILEPQVYDEFLAQTSSWQQAKPFKSISSQSVPGYFGFISFYDAGQSRQMLLSEGDFLVCKTLKCEGVQAGRLMLALGHVLLKRGNHAHKSNDEIAALTPKQRVDEYFKEHAFHPTALDEQEILLGDYLFKDGLKALPALAEIANRYDSEREEYDDEATGNFGIAFKFAEQIDYIIVRLRGTEEGHAALKVFEDVLMNRMKKAGYDKPQHRFYRTYEAYLEDLQTMQGKDINIADEIIQNTLAIKHQIQLSNEEMLKFSDYLTSVNPTYPAQCRGSYSDSVCTNSQEIYEAYLKFKNKAAFNLLDFDKVNPVVKQFLMTF